MPLPLLPLPAPRGEVSNKVRRRGVYSSPFSIGVFKTPLRPDFVGPPPRGAQGGTRNHHSTLQTTYSPLFPIAHSLLPIAFFFGTPFVYIHYRAAAVHG
jgi:hypothetical protein